MTSPFPKGTRARLRGLTLIEVLISTAILGILFAGITGALLANQEQYGTHAEVAELQSTLRLATAQLEHSLSRAGYGIDPSYAVDTWRRAADGTEDPAGSRDGSGPFGSDELVVHFRDPLFEAAVVTATSDDLTLQVRTPNARPLEAGERLLVLCSNGLADDASSAYITIAKAEIGGGSVTVSVAGGSLPPFNEGPTLASGCMSDGTARAYRVERRHYFIAWLFMGAGRPPRPALMVSRGTDRDGSGTADEMPTNWRTPSLANGGGSEALGDAELLAFDVEQLQVAYLMNEPTQGWKDKYSPLSQDQGGDWIFGNDPAVVGEAPRWDPTKLSLGSIPIKGAPLLDTPRTECLLDMQLTKDPTDGCGYGAKRRYTNHPGNIRGVRVSVVVRGSSEDLKLSPSVLSLTAAGDGPLENLVAASLPPPSRHRRQRLQTTISLKNMLQQRHFLEAANFDLAAAPPAATP